jgi:hypothetical protein
MAPLEQAEVLGQAVLDASEPGRIRFTAVR